MSESVGAKSVHDGGVDCGSLSGDGVNTQRRQGSINSRPDDARIRHAYYKYNGGHAHHHISSPISRARVKLGGRRTQIAGCGIDSCHRLSLGHAHEQEDGD